MNEAKKILNDLDKKIDDLNNEQKNEETDAVQKKTDIITEALIDFRKNVITEKIKNIEGSFGQINEKIHHFNDIIEKSKDLINYIEIIENEINHKFYFIAK